ncbi:MAG: NAD(P)-dependent oxidoreductase, partial [Calditrichota bacterium]
VALGEDGFLKAGHRLWIDCSTTNPAFVRRLAEEAEKNNVRFMDAPVAGSLGQAERAELVFLAGGDEADLAAATPLLEAMGNRTAHIGDVGMGMSLKLVLNHLLACSMVAFGEAMHLGMALGIEKEHLLNTLIGGPVVPPYMQMKKNKLQSSVYEAEFPLRLIHKDMQMVASAAAEVSVPLPVANCVKEVFLSAKNAGYEDADFSAVAAFLENR